MANLAKLVVIFGINSRQGSSVAHFLNGKGIRVRGITRDATSDASKAWAGTGVHIFEVKEPHKETELLNLGVQGASAVFVVTDYFYHYLNDHSTVSLASVTRNNVHRHAADREFLDGQAIVLAVEKEASRNFNQKIAMLDDAAKEPSPKLKEMLIKGANVIPQVKRIVLSSLIFPIKQLNNSWDTLAPGMQQFRAKGQIWDHLQANCEQVASLSIRLIPALRMEDWTDFLLLKPDGTFAFGSTLPTNYQLPWTHFANDTGTLFHLCLQQPQGLTVNGYSDVHTAEQICDIVAKLTGMPCDHVQYTEQTLVQMLGPDRGQVVVDMLACLLRREYYNYASVRHSQDLIQIRSDAERYKLTSMAEYVTESLPDYLIAKGWNGVSAKGSGETGENQRLLFEECLEKSRQRKAQILVERILGRGTVAEMAVPKPTVETTTPKPTVEAPPSQSIVETPPPKTTAEMPPPKPILRTPSPKRLIEGLPPRPVMEPFTPPSAKSEGSKSQVDRSSSPNDRPIRAPLFRPSSQTLDFFEGDLMQADVSSNSIGGLILAPFPSQLSQNLDFFKGNMTQAGESNPTGGLLLPPFPRPPARNLDFGRSNMEAGESSRSKVGLILPPFPQPSTRNLDFEGNMMQAGGSSIDEMIRTPFLRPSARNLGFEGNMMRAGESGSSTDELILPPILHPSVRNLGLEGSMMQADERSNLTSGMMPPPYPRQLSQNLDFLDFDQLPDTPTPSSGMDPHSRSFSHFRLADTPDQGPSRPAELGDKRVAKVVEVIDLRSRSPSVLSSATESEMGALRAGDQLRDLSASSQGVVGGSRVDARAQEQQHAPSQPSTQPVSALEVIDLRSRSSSRLSSVPASEPSASAATQQHQRQYVTAPVRPSSMYTALHNQNQANNQPDTPSQPSTRSVASLEVIDLRSRSSSGLSSVPASENGPSAATQLQRQYLTTPVFPSGINTAMRNRTPIQHHAPAQPTMPQQIIDLRSRASSGLSSAPDSEPPTSEAGDQSQELDIPVHSSDVDSDIDIDIRDLDPDWVPSGLSSPFDTESSQEWGGAQRYHIAASVQSADNDMPAPDQDQDQDHEQAEEQPSSAIGPATSAPEVGEQNQEQDESVKEAEFYMQGQDQEQTPAQQETQESGQSQPDVAGALDTPARRRAWMDIIM